MALAQQGAGFGGDFSYAFEILKTRCMANS